MMQTLRTMCLSKKLSMWCLVNILDGFVLHISVQLIVALTYLFVYLTFEFKCSIVFSSGGMEDVEEWSRDSLLDGGRDGLPMEMSPRTAPPRHLAYGT